MLLYDFHRKLSALTQTNRRHQMLVPVSYLLTKFLELLNRLCYMNLYLLSINAVQSFCNVRLSFFLIYFFIHFGYTILVVNNWSFFLICFTLSMFHSVITFLPNRSCSSDCECPWTLRTSPHCKSVVMGIFVLRWITTRFQLGPCVTSEQAFVNIFMPCSSM